MIYHLLHLFFIIITIYSTEYHTHEQCINYTDECNKTILTIIDTNEEEIGCYVGKMKDKDVYLKSNKTGLYEHLCKKQSQEHSSSDKHIYLDYSNYTINYAHIIDDNALQFVIIDGESFNKHVITFDPLMQEEGPKRMLIGETNLSDVHITKSNDLFVYKISGTQLQKANFTYSKSVSWMSVKDLTFTPDKLKIVNNNELYICSNKDKKLIKSTIKDNSTEIHFEEFTSNIDENCTENIGTTKSTQYFNSVVIYNNCSSQSVAVDKITFGTTAILIIIVIVIGLFFFISIVIVMGLFIYFMYIRSRKNKEKNENIELTSMLGDNSEPKNPDKKSELDDGSKRNINIKNVNVTSVGSPTNQSIASLNNSNDNPIKKNANPESSSTSTNEQQHQSEICDQDDNNEN